MSKQQRARLSSKPRPFRIPTHFYIAGTAIAGATAYTTYRYLTYHREAAAAVDDGADEGCTCSSSVSRFDRLAPKYDNAVGSEETWMGYGLMRSWLLRQAKGAVLELSAGTGRNLAHYPYTLMSSLTLTDLSQPMLKQAEDKYFDELRLGNRHPEVRVSFDLADAHCLIADEKAAAAVGGHPSSQESPQKRQSRWWPWSFSSQGSDPASPASQASSEGSSSTTPSTADPSSSQPPIRPFRGERGSIFNLFRVLVPGAFDKPQSKSQGSMSDAELQAVEGYRTAHRFEQAAYQRRCRAGADEAGHALSRYPPHSFDTIVDTFGLCSHDDPIQVLRQAASLCKPDGQILLLQHGRSSWDWWNQQLDTGAQRHKQKWGCYWNRDIERICAEAGLQVDSLSRWHFGTTYIITARPLQSKVHVSQT